MNFTEGLVFPKLSFSPNAISKFVSGNAWPSAKQLAESNTIPTRTINCPDVPEFDPGLCTHS